MIEPSKPARGMDVLAWCELLWRYVRKIRIDVGPGLEIRRSSNGSVISVKNPNTGGGAAAICPFGEIMRHTVGEGEEAETKTGIRGGLVYCGNKNFATPAKELDLETSGTWLIYLEVECEANRDDDGEIILPGIKTSAATDPSTFWKSTSWSAGSGETAETQYPDNDEPEVSDGLGKIIVPIGKLTIADGAATLLRVACGNVTISQCGGILSHTRG